MNQDPSKGELPAEMIMLWMDGELAPAETAEVSRHVDGCAECRTRCAELRKGSSELRAWEIAESGRARAELARLLNRSRQGWPALSLWRPRYAVVLGAALLGLTFWAQRSPSRIHVDEQTVRAKLLKTQAMNPKYPEEARKNRIEGEVILHIVVAPGGTVKQLDVRKGDPVLAKAAVEGVRKWRFEPTVVDGKRVEVESEVRVEFKLLP